MCTIHESYKNIYFIEFLSPLPLKNIFSFFLFLFLSLSLFGFSSSSSFLLMFFYLPHLLFASPIYSGSLSSPIFIVIAHFAAPRRQLISPSPPSHRLPNADKPSPLSHRRSKLHCRPKLHHQSKLHWHHLYRTQECRGFRSWISWQWLDFMGFSGFHDGSLAGFHGGWVSWVNGSDLCGSFWLI